MRKRSYYERIVRTKISASAQNAGLTQEEVATKLNITPQAVSKWENDASAPDISVLAELSDILSVSLDELLGKQPTVKMAEPASDKGNKVLRISVKEKDGEKVNINLPLVLVKTLLDSGLPVNLINSNSDVVTSIDFSKIIEIAESGVVGKLLEVEGDDNVEIWIE